MKPFFELPAQRRRRAFQRVDELMGLQAFRVEKDFWVCWILRELFTLPGIGEHLTFNGGLSLSKAWCMIQRFSEDIDIIIDQAPLGFAGDASPEQAPGNQQRRVRLENLMTGARAWVQGTLQPALAQRLAATLGSVDWKLEVDPDLDDGPCLRFHYASVFPPGSAGQILPQVKIGFGARSDAWPAEPKVLTSYVLEHFPALGHEPSVAVRALASERTFWEKACLLHEETFRPAGQPRRLRLAHHYYDVWCLLRAGVGARALSAMNLFQRVARHREIFFRQSWVDYSTHHPGTFRLVPWPEQMPAWEADFAALRGPMFFGPVPQFAEIIAAVSGFERRFNQLVPPPRSPPDATLRSSKSKSKTVHTARTFFGYIVK